MYPVIWWAIAAVVLFILELVTASFFFLWIGAGAALTAILSFFVDNEKIQYVTFAVSSVLLVAVSRPWANRISGGTKREANVDSLVGKTGTVTKVEKNQPSIGYVKVDGEFWKAETDNQEPLALHGQVTVTAVRSNVLVVKA